MDGTERLATLRRVPQFFLHYDSNCRINGIAFMLTPASQQNACYTNQLAVHRGDITGRGTQDVLLVLRLR